MTNLNSKKLNSIKNTSNYRSEKVGMSNGNLANFTALRGAIAKDSLFLVFFSFLYTGLASTVTIISKKSEI